MEGFMKRVVIESPYAGAVEANLEYLQECIRDSLSRGEAPFASHQMYTDALDDRVLDQRVLGINAGFEWWMTAETVVFYLDHGMSVGMAMAKGRCIELGKDFEERYLYSSCKGD
jgi:hypothetical protein